MKLDSQGLNSKSLSSDSRINEDKRRQGGRVRAGGYKLGASFDELIVAATRCKLPSSLGPLTGVTRIEPGARDARNLDVWAEGITTLRLSVDDDRIARVVYFYTLTKLPLSLFINRFCVTPLPLMGRMRSSELKRKKLPCLSEVRETR